MDFYVRSDLACESLATEERVEGTDWQVDHRDGFAVGRLRIRTADAAARLGRECGDYITVECGNPAFLGEERYESLVELLSEELRVMTERLTEKRIDSELGILVAGLGNAGLTADAIGPKTVEKLTATRHLREQEPVLYRELGCSSLSAIAPGVLGQTGIETLELLRGATRAIRPDVILAIDALAARSCDRLASTVQITDTGICPGSGVGNHRAAISRETLGVPVMTVGVPTVVNSATLVWDALRLGGVTEVDEGVRQVLENGKSFFVSPKESDVIVESISSVLARAISHAFTASL